MATTQTTERNGGQVARRTPDPFGTVYGMLEKSKQQIAMAVPKHMTAERMIRMAATVLRRTPKLLACDPLTLVACVVQASELGLELSGPLGQAYMVPRKNKHTKKLEAGFQIGYRGYIRLAFNSGLVRSFNAHVVREGDEFAYRYGTNAGLHHVPAARERGTQLYVYAVLTLKDGTTDFEVMSAADVEDHRKRYSQADGDDSPWNTAWDEMAKKTVIRKLAKRAPLSTEIVAAVSADEAADHGPEINAPADDSLAALAARNRVAGTGESSPARETVTPAGEVIDADPADPDADPLASGDAQE